MSVNLAEIFKVSFAGYPPVSDEHLLVDDGRERQPAEHVLEEANHLRRVVLQQSGATHIEQLLSPAKAQRVVPLNTVQHFEARRRTLAPGGTHESLYVGNVTLQCEQCERNNGCVLTLYFDITSLMNPYLEREKRQFTVGTHYPFFEGVEFLEKTRVLIQENNETSIVRIRCDVPQKLSRLNQHSKELEIRAPPVYSSGSCSFGNAEFVSVQCG